MVVDHPSGAPQHGDESQGLPNFDSCLADTSSVGYYAVGIVDILNQRQKLQQWSELPTDGSLSQDLLAALQETIGTVAAVRDTLVGYISGYGQSGAASAKRVQGLGRPELSDWFHAKLGVFSFADTVVLYTPMEARAGMAPMRDLLGLLTAFAVTFPLCLANRVVMRGALEVGAGADAFKDQLYGPVLASVHQLESEIADYPRIVIGPEIHRFLKAMRHNPSQPNRQLMRETADFLLSAIYEDDDGVMTLDYLGSSFQKLDVLDKSDTIRAYLTLGFEFIRAEHRRFEAANDRKLTNRYRRLRAYWEARLPNWGIITASS